MLLPAILENRRPHRLLVVVQSSTAQSALPLVRGLIQAETRPTLVFCFAFSPLAFSTVLDRQTSTFYDWTSRIPGFTDKQGDIYKDILDTINQALPGALTVVIDSVDTLASNIGTHTRTLTLISSILSLLRARTQPSRLVLHIDDSLAPGLAPQLVQTRLSPSLAHLSVHPIALLKHVATTYLTPPPPLTPLERYWRVFAPIAARPAESERLVFGPEGTGRPSAREMIVDILMRGGGDASGANGRTRGAERVFEAWTEAGACELSDLGALKDVYSRKMSTHESGPDPTQNVSFNLNLTLEQQQQRAKVPLPYAHEGKPAESAASAPVGAIYYDPDSADDIDDDDPDEDLDI